MTYEVVKALHLIAVIAWMAGLLYLPRLYVYHSGVAVGSEASELFKVMERRLLRAITTPAMLASWGFGLWLIHINGGLEWLKVAPWMHAKLTLLLLMTGAHGVLAKHRRQFAADLRPRSAIYFRVLNEVPTLLLIGVVVLAVLKPF